MDSLLHRLTDRGHAGYSATNAVLRCNTAVNETIGLLLLQMKHFCFSCMY